MKIDYEEIHHNFTKDRDSNKELANIYSTIKNDYLNDEKLNIPLEKIYIEEKLDTYAGEAGKFYDEIISKLLQILLGLVGPIFTIYYGKDFAPIITFGYFLILIFATLGLKQIRKPKIAKEKNQYFYYVMCLDVLNEIEEEQKSNKTVKVKKPVLNK